ncbi:peptide ABC transporter substrate-binding protein [Rubrobacter taiwanensis]|uniref:Peptide ABC transporter substrate-binding protein n=1 Tax=Rubrobacter taiwanensis TaxID=185139 RepID=A0A4R1BHG3_9ACTN|nr:ABC transporter substrate-binding protein [Rubrobacter taiwanensis]TCJ16725.1 peptide ABC transporter substrate-binding protein [Rubrobacter taiwanensis]
MLRSGGLLGVGVALLIFAFGCGGGSGEADRLTIAVPQDVGPLNIFAQHEEPLTELVYDKLLAPSPYVEEPRPWLAESVERIDPETWEVTVRDGITWHDGEPFAAGDVKFTFEYFLEAPTGRWTHHISEVPHVEEVEIVDENTLRLSCAYPCPELGPVTLADLPILPQHIWEDVPGDRAATYNELPVGTGPYRLVEYSAERGYRFEANEDYFAGRPLVDELVMPIIEDTAATFTALRSGELDAAARNVPPELVPEFESSRAIALAETAPLQFDEIRINYEREPFDIPEFRQAFSLAVDRRELLDTVLLGQGRPGTQGYPHPDSPWTSPDNRQPYDPERARQILDGLGFVDRDGDGVRETPDGNPLEFTIKVAGTEPSQVRAAELVVKQLGEAGISMTVQTLDPGAMGELFTSRDFDTSLGTITAHGVADPTQFIMSHRSGYLWNLPEVPYPEMEALIEEWMQATTVEERTRISFEMQELFNSQPTSIVLYYPEERWAYRPDAHDGWVESPGYGIVHKWSFLPEEVGNEANAITERF